MELAAASGTRASATSAAVRMLDGLARHVNNPHFPAISNRHLAIRNQAISLKTRRETFSNRHGSGRSSLLHRESFADAFGAKSTRRLSWETSQRCRA